MRTAAGGLGKAAHYVHTAGVKDLAIGIDRAVRRRPAASILMALVAGFFVGRALRPR